VTPSKVTPSNFPRWLVLSFLAAVVVVGALSWLVGIVGGNDGFDWELAAVFGTALGTTLLAATTGGLAYLTARDVSATRELAQLQRDEQVAGERPTVLLHTAAYSTRVEAAGITASSVEYINVTLRNVGLGPALNVLVRATLATPRETLTTDWFRWAAIMPGTDAAFSIPIQPQHGVEPNEPRVRVSGTYTDRRQMGDYPVLTNLRTGLLPELAEPEG
jgi:hypothetical protein